MLFPRETIASLETGASSARGVASFPASWPLFRGHFPGRPVVPAYVLIGFARSLCEEALAAPVELVSLERMKLSRAVGPDEPVTCAVSLEGTRVRAQLSTSAGDVGTLVFSIRVGA